MTGEEESAEELLRKASDPTTPGNRLYRIAFRLVAKGESFSFFRGPMGKQAVVLALRNPSLPYPALAQALAQVQLAPIAWFNPSVPLAMLTHPDWPWEKWAHEALSRCIPYSQQPLLLHELVARVATGDVAPDRPKADTAALARHIAGLFSLPWQEEPSDPSIPLSK